MVGGKVTVKCGVIQLDGRCFGGGGGGTDENKEHRRSSGEGV